MEIQTEPQKTEPQKTVLNLAPGVALPLETVTSRNGDFGISGSGKTYTASVLAEEMLAARAHVVVFDPLGVWWGLGAVPEGDASTDATPIYILGGDHADLPLDPKAGAAIADLVIDEGLSVVLDMSGFEDDAQKALFVAAFSTRLLTRNRLPLHVFVDEADLFVPETAMGKEEAACRKAVDNMVRRGRVKGIGVTLISQRPAVVAKNVLTQCTTLMVHQLTGQQDQSAMARWFGDHGTAEQQKAVIASLSSLGKGEAWVWTPGAEGLVRTQIRKRRTFDSSATPKFGEVPIVARRLAAPDLSALRERLAVTVEAEKENDVELLKAKIKALTEQLKERPVEVQVVEKEKRVVERVEVPVFRAGEAERLQRAIDELMAIAEQLVGLSALGKDIHAVGSDIRAALQRSAASQESAKSQESEVAPVSEPVSPPVPSPVAVAPKGKSAVVVKPTDKLTGPQQKILNALATFDRLGRMQTERALVGVWAGYSASSGTFRNYLGELKGMGLVSLIAPDRMAITDLGRVSAHTDLPKLDSLQTLHAAWFSRMTGPQQKLQEVLVRAYPRAITREALAIETGYSATSGTFRNYMGELRSLGIAEFPDTRAIRATSLMFPEELLCDGK